MLVVLCQSSLQPVTAPIPPIPGAQMPWASVGKDHSGTLRNQTSAPGRPKNADNEKQMMQRYYCFDVHHLRVDVCAVPYPTEISFSYSGFRKKWAMCACSW